MSLAINIITIYLILLFFLLLLLNFEFKITLFLLIFSFMIICSFISYTLSVGEFNSIRNVRVNKEKFGILLEPVRRILISNPFNREYSNDDVINMLEAENEV